jgi:hypothetical protein
MSGDLIEIDLKLESKWTTGNNFTLMDKEEITARALHSFSV